jgi:hypothetical protein
MIAASCTEIILERLKLGLSNLRDTNRLQSNPRWPLHIVLQLVKKCWPKNHTDFTTKLLNSPVPRSHQSLPQPSWDSGLFSWCRFLIYWKKKTLEPTLPETHQNANLSNSFEVLSILKTSKPHKTILRKTPWFKIMTIPTETFAYQFSAFARSVYCFVRLFWTLDCARSADDSTTSQKHRKSSSNQPQNEI